MSEVCKRHRSAGLRTALAVPIAVLLMPALSSAAVKVAENGPTETLVGNYLAAHHAEYLGDSAAAADFLTQVLKEDPNDPTVQRRAFIHLVASGRVGESVELAEKVTGGGQTEALATITRTVAAAREGDYEAADALLDNSLPGSFGQFMVPLLRAWIRQGLGDTTAAVEALAPLGETEGFQLFRDFHSALIYDVAGNSEQAEKSYTAAMGDGDTPSSRLIEAQISFLLRQGRIDEAQALFDAASEEEKDSVALTMAAADLAQGLAEALFEVAAELKREGAPNVALILAQLSIYLRPNFDIARILVAEILDDQDQFDEALRNYNRIPADSLLNWQVRVRQADLLSKTGKVEEAIDLLEEMAQERPDRPEPLIKIGHILRSEKRFDEAVSAYDRAVSRIPELSARYWPLLYARGIALERSKKWPRAEKDFLQALEFNPDQPYVLNYLGYSWVDQGIHLDRARKMIERAVELRPRDGYIVDSLGWALYRMGDFDTAVKRLENAVELQPEDPVINDHLGDAYWRVGRFREARFQWKRALSLHPDADQIEIIQLKLDQGLSGDSPEKRDS
jgi:tetratricopeptide (TPR) repeat protein